MWRIEATISKNIGIITQIAIGKLTGIPEKVRLYSDGLIV